MKPFQSFTGTVVEKKNLTHDVLFLSLQVPEEFTFKAGQFVSIIMEKDGEKKNRSYSILSPPSKKGFLDLCVKVVPDGFASEIFDTCKKGDTFEIKGPLGFFNFAEKSEHKDHWFICTGTGITPFYSMIYEYLEKHPETQFTLLFGVRHERDLFFYEEFRELAKEHANFRFIPTLSGEKAIANFGRVQKFLPDDLSGKVFYICGLKDLVLETRQLLMDKGVNVKDVEVERYT